MIRVLLADDHKLIRCGIRSLLDLTAGISVEQEVGSGESAVEYVRKTPPDVVLMDVSMPGIGGMEATRRIVQIAPQVKVVALTVHEDDPFPGRLLEAGATGYLTKGASVDEMVRAIQQVHRGERYITPAVAGRLTKGDDSPFDVLSSREFQVLLMLLQGIRPQLISDELHVSPKTISTYRQRIYQKLGVQNDSELTRFAIRYGLTDSG